MSKVEFGIVNIPTARLSQSEIEVARLRNALAEILATANDGRYTPSERLGWIEDRAYEELLRNSNQNTE